MVLTCGRCFVVLVLIDAVIQGSFGVDQSGENGESSAIFYDNKDHNDIMEIMQKGLCLLEANTIECSNRTTGDLREVARKKDSSKGGGSMMSRILPLLILPFLISSSLIPIMLMSIKLLMIKSAIVGKIAIILMLLNFFRGRTNQGGVVNHYPEDLAQEHYGYHGVEEPGAYVNKRRRKRHLR